MSYGTIKVDTITFTDGGVDKSVSVSGFIQNPTITGNISVTGTISGNLIEGQTISGTTVTGNTGVFTTVTGGSAGFTTVTGTTVTGTTANFATLSGTTITGSVGNFGSGSEAAPSVSVGTTDNGIYSPGTNQVAISTNGTGRLFIDASGKLGVGTSAPLSQFVVSNGGAAGLEVSPTGFSSAPAILSYNRSGTAYTQLTLDGASNVFAINGTERMRLDASGRLGLGTSTLRQVAGATANLQNERTGAGGGAALSLLTNSSSGVASQLTLGASRGAAGTPTSVLSTDVVGTINFFGADGTDYDKIVASVRARAIGTITSDRVPGQLEFYTAENDAGSTLTQRLTIDNQGRVGVGTTSPQALLDVSASAPELRISSSNTGQTSGSSVGKLSIYTSDATTPGGAGVVGFIEATSATSNGSDYQLLISKREGSGGGSNFINLGTSASGAISFGTNTSGAGTERARIDSSGRLLVGTSTSPSAGNGQYARIVAQGFIGGSAGGGYISIQRGQAATSITADAEIGLINFGDSAGNSFGGIACRADATAGAGDYPSRLVFSTTADGASSPTERMRITSGGNVYIGSTAYDYRLTVQSEAGNVRTAYIRANAGGFTDDVLVLDTGTAAGTGFNLLQAYSNAVAQFRVRGDGTIYAQNTTVQSISDARVKENITESADGLSVIINLRPVRFDFKEGFGNNRKNQLGFIAQEVEAVFPDAVDVASESANDGEDPYKSVGPGAFIPVLVKAIQEQQAMIVELQAEVAALKAS